MRMIIVTEKQYTAKGKPKNKKFPVLYPSEYMDHMQTEI